MTKRRSAFNTSTEDGREYLRFLKKNSREVALWPAWKSGTDPGRREEMLARWWEFLDGGWKTRLSEEPGLAEHCTARILELLTRLPMTRWTDVCHELADRTGADDELLVACLLDLFRKNKVVLLYGLVALLPLPNEFTGKDLAVILGFST